jgi:uncharacterized protein (TIGR03437 family)
MLRPISVLLVLFSASLVLEAQQFRAFWADAFHSGYKTPEEVDRLVDDAIAARANAIFMESRVYSDSFHLHTIEPPFEDPAYSPGFDALQNLIEKAHARGLQVHAWSVVMRMWKPGDPPKDPNHVWYSHGPDAKGDDMWMTVNAAGKKSTFADPGNPGAMQHIVDAIIEPLKYYELDGIHLDYVRYPEDDNWGWNPASVTRFQRLTNRVGTPNAADARWSEFRRQQVTQLVRQIYLRAAAIRPKAAVSAALITWGDGPSTDTAFLSRDAYSRVFQDWRSWMEEGILDIAMPMNYFRENQYPTWLDHWLEFEKDRQYRRALVPGLGAYLNPIASTLAQAQRALAPSAKGNKAWGVVFYSYAGTNSEGKPNADFYGAAADMFGASAAAPALPWKANPSTGHVYGRLTVDDGPAWLKDGVTIQIESDTGKAFARSTITDSTGFFGAVDLPPDRYRVRVERGGVEVYRAAAKEVKAGEAVGFDLPLRADHFTGATPRIAGADKKAAAPGDFLTISGQVLGVRYEQAAQVPLPQDLGKTMVLVNGTPAPLLQVSPDFIALQLPYQQAQSWDIVVRNDSMESGSFRVDAVEAAPVILGARRVNGGYVELYCTGLGRVSPATFPAGAGAAPEALPRVVANTVVKLSTKWFEGEVKPSYAGLAPYLPGRYQVNFQLPDGFTSGTVRLQVGDSVSADFRIE